MHDQDAFLVFGIVAGTQPQFRVIVGGEPEDVVAGLWRMNVATNSRAVLLLAVDGTFKQGEQIRTGGLVGKVFEFRECTDAAAGDVEPEITLNDTGW
jgi:small-conductance mechanosensitive channel